MAQRRKQAVQHTTDEIFDALALDLRADDYRVRSAAVGALGKIEDARAMSLICRALGDPRKRVRARAAQALGRNRSPEALDALTPALHDRTATVRKQAVEAIGKIADAREALDLLLPMLHDSDVAVVHKTVDICAAFRDPRTIEPFLDAAKTQDANLLRRLLLALAPFPDLRKVVVLCSAAAVRTGGISHLAARQLNELGDAQSLPRALVRAETLPVKFRFEALESLRGVHVRAWFRLVMLHYPLPPIPEFCARMEAADSNADVRRGARQLLDYANLLRGSQFEVGAAELLRGASGPGAVESTDLVRGSQQPDTASGRPRVRFLERLLQRNTPRRKR